MCYKYAKHGYDDKPPIIITEFIPNYIECNDDNTCKICNSLLIINKSFSITDCNHMWTCKCPSVRRTIYKCHNCENKCCCKCNKNKKSYEMTYVDNNYHCLTCYDNYFSETKELFLKNNPNPSTDDHIYHLENKFTEFPNKNLKWSWDLHMILFNCSSCNKSTKNYDVCSPMNYCNDCFKNIWLINNPDPSDDKFKYKMNIINEKYENKYNIEIKWELIEVHTNCLYCKKNVKMVGSDIKFMNEPICDKICEQLRQQNIWKKNNPDPSTNEIIYKIIIYDKHYNHKKKFPNFIFKWKIHYYVCYCNKCNMKFNTLHKLSSLCSKCGVKNGYIEVTNDIVPKIYKLKYKSHKRHTWGKPSNIKINDEQYDYICECCK